MTTEGRKRLLIVGGGFAGVNLAVLCSSFIDVTIVDRKNFFEINWANVRAVVNTETAEKMNIPYSSVPKAGKVVVGTVASLTPTHALLEDGSTIDFDYVAICTGHSYASTLGHSAESTLTERLKELAAWRSRIEAAKDVLIIGGGPSGVETAAEIVEAFAGKNVTIVHSGTHLVFREPNKAQLKVHAAVEKWLAAHNVKVIKESKVITPVASTRTDYELSNSTTVSADVALLCTGSGRPNTGFMAAEMGYALDGQGAVKVNEYFQVTGKDGKPSPNIFALGDVTDLKENKRGYIAGEHAKLAAKNIKAALEAKSFGKPWKLNAGTDMIALSLGPAAGAGHMGGCVFPSCMVAGMKSKGLFLDKVRKDIGLK